MTPDPGEGAVRPPPPMPDVAKVKPTMETVSALVTRETMQPRSTISREIITKYRGILASRPKAFPPILVARLTDPGEEASGLVVVDGYHRVAAARQAGVKRLAAKVVKVSRSTAEWMAVLANREHGLPLDRKADLGNFCRYMDDGRNVDAEGRLKSYRQLVGDMDGARGRSTYVRWMAKSYPSVAAAMAKREAVEPDGATPEPGALDYERKLTDYAEGAARVAGVMQAQQSKAWKRHAVTAGWSPAEAERQANERTREVLLTAARGLLDATAKALGIAPSDVMQELEKQAEEQDALPF